MAGADAYKAAGVDIAAGDEAVRLIQGRAEGTFALLKAVGGRMLGGLGGFCSLYETKEGRIIASSTDGVGTKLLIAIAIDKNNTVGQDLVAMCVNDILANGISPLMFLDYFATGKQTPERTAAIVGGIIDGCQLAGCALVGGEMAEMPGMYAPGHYDLAGFAIGMADSIKDVIAGEEIRPGMYVYGLASSGIHSNGYSLARKLFDISPTDEQVARRALEQYHPSLGRTLGEELLEPTVIYVPTVMELLQKHSIKGLAHITGGGLLENPPRILPAGCAIEFKTGSWPVPSIFDLMREKGRISDMDMWRTFNCGIGFILVSPDEIQGDGIYPIGRVITCREGGDKVLFV